MNIPDYRFWDIPEGNVDRLVVNGNTLFEDTTDYSRKFFFIRRWIGTDNLKIKITTTLQNGLTLHYKYDTEDYFGTEYTINIDSGSTGYIDMTDHEIVSFSGSTPLGTDQNNYYTRISCVYADDTSTQAPFSVNGCITSLVAGDPSHVIINPGVYIFNSLFANSLVQTAKNLILPISTSTGMYNEMFLNCTQLKIAPTITTTTIGTNIIYCFRRMFYNCSSLNYVKCYLTNISNTGTLYNWMYGVPNTASNHGTFVKQSSVTYPSGASGIPSNWTIQNI